MEKNRKILSHNIFTNEEKHHISGITQFVENIEKLKNTENFFENLNISRLEVEINITNAFDQNNNSARSVISNMKGFDKNGERVEDITHILMNKIGFVSSPLQKLLQKYIPNEKGYVYKNISIDFSKDWKEDLKANLITNNLLKKIEVALLESDLESTNQNTKKNKIKI